MILDFIRQSSFKPQPTGGWFHYWWLKLLGVDVDHHIQVLAELDAEAAWFRAINRALTHYTDQPIDHYVEVLRLIKSSPQTPLCNARVRQDLERFIWDRCTEL